MAHNAPQGSANRLVCFAPSSGALGAVAFTFNKTTNENHNGDIITTDYSLEFTSKVISSAFSTFKTTYLKDVNLTVAEDTYTDGSVDKSVTVPSTAVPLISVWVGGEHPVDGNRETRSFRSIFTKGAEPKTPNTVNEVTCTLTAVAAEQEYTLSSATLDTEFSDIISFTADISIITGAYGEESWHPAA